MNELEAIYCKLLDCDRSSLYLDKRREFLSTRQQNLLKSILRRRKSGEPLQYLLGDVDFMGLRLTVDRRVLIPRPETEILVDEAVRNIRLSGCLQAHILDIGTGSGNIAIAVAKFLKDAKVTSVDISKLALAVAKNNAVSHDVLDRVSLRRSDMFSCFKNEKQTFDFIISNPPYIAQHEYAGLPIDVRREPKEALVAQEDGLYFYKKIEEGSRVYLKKSGMIFLEIGAGQAQGIKDIFSQKDVWSDIKFIKDYNDIDRVAIIKKVNY